LPFSGYVGPNLSNGSATLSVELPENSQPGDTLLFVAEVSDESRVEPFINRFIVHVAPAIQPAGKPGGKKQPPSDKKGTQHDLPTKIDLPNPTLVEEKDWGKHEPPFDKFTALRVRQPTASADDLTNGTPAYDFFVNIDNVHLLRELKIAKESPEVVKKRFELALILLGLGLLQDEQKEPSVEKDVSSVQKTDPSDNGAPNVEDKIEAFTKAVAPVLLPMIGGLGAIQEESLAVTAEAAGEAV
jgi:hypothetical protein